ncbi:MAG: hypothetical protein V7K38_03715 [Nostoc sp.]|uniref:hypothetical protein n=1 Tax=Nostoc sp. TaxID=1180 RepID=UPI002FF9A416
MNQDFTQQWLTEIQELREQMATLQSDRNTAWESTQKWRQLYNTEAEQRRTDAQLSQQAIASLKADLHKLRGFEVETLAAETSVTTIQKEIEQLKSVEELQAKLIAVIKERDRLLQALKTEQDNHAQTRNSLTTALGDAIDRLTQERAAAEKESK